LKTKATGLQLEQQQKLCIARLLPLKPDIILMDEPCSALDVEGTHAIEELMFTLRNNYTIIIVTHTIWLRHGGQVMNVFSCFLGNSSNTAGQKTFYQS
jgi:ABC-type phosphate transport system ATPase subunit